MNVSITSIGGGALPALFEESLQKVLEDIADESKSADTPRTITLTVKIKPDKGRAMSIIECSSAEKLAPQNKSKGVVYHRLTDKGILTAESTDPKQQELIGLISPEEKNAHVR